MPHGFSITIDCRRRTIVPLPVRLIGVPSAGSVPVIDYSVIRSARSLAWITLSTLPSSLAPMLMKRCKSQVYTIQIIDNLSSLRSKTCILFIKCYQESNVAFIEFFYLWFEQIFRSQKFWHRYYFSVFLVNVIRIHIDSIIRRPLLVDIKGCD